MSIKKQSHGKNEYSDVYFSVFIGAIVVAFLVLWGIKFITESPDILFITASGWILGMYIKHLFYSEERNLKYSSALLVLFFTVLFLCHFFLGEGIQNSILRSNKIGVLLKAIGTEKMPIIDIKFKVYTFVSGCALYFSFFFLLVKKDEARKKSLFNPLSTLKFKSKMSKNEREFMDRTGFYIGENMLTGEEEFLSKENRARHIQIFGGSGSGKTNLLKGLIEVLVRRGESVIFMDMKAEKELENWLRECHKKYNKEERFRLLSTNDPYRSISFNPFDRKDFIEILSVVDAAYESSEPFYRERGLNALGLVLEYYSAIRSSTDQRIDIDNIIDFMKYPEVFDELEAKHEFYKFSEEKSEEIKRTLFSKDGAKEKTGILTVLENIKRSRLGQNLKKENAQNTLLDYMKNRNFLYVQLNSMTDKLSSSIIGKLILQNFIMTVGDSNASDRPDRFLNCTLIIDEFRAFATPNFVDLIDRARSAGLRIIISHQSLADLEAVGESFSKQIWDNMGSKIIFGSGRPEEAEFLSNCLGTETKEKETRMKFEGEILEVGSSRESEAYKFHPNDVKDLKVGEAILMRRWAGNRFAKVKLPLASSFKKTESNEVARTVKIPHARIRNNHNL